MPYYTTPVNDRLFIPSTPKSQNVPYKNMTENIYQGEINPRYDNTILEGTVVHASSTTAPAWLSVSRDSGGVSQINESLNSDIVAGTADSNIVASRVGKFPTLSIYNGTTGTGTGTFNTETKVGEINGGPLCTIREMDETGKVINMAVIKTVSSTNIITKSVVVKHTDGSYYLILASNGDISVYSPVVPDGSGTLPPLVKAWDDIVIPGIHGSDITFIIKYSPELVPSSMNAIDATGYINYSSAKLDLEGNLVLLGFGAMDNVVTTNLRLFYPANSGTTLNAAVTYGIASGTGFQLLTKLDSNLNFIWYTTTNYASTYRVNGYLDIDGGNNIYASSLIGNLPNINHLAINSANLLNDPSSSGYFDVNDVDKLYTFLMKYDSFGQFEWVIRNSMENTHEDYINISGVSDGNLVYLSYGVNTAGDGDHSIFEKYSATGGSAFGTGTIIGKLDNYLGGTDLSKYIITLQYDTTGVLQWLDIVKASDSITTQTIITSYIPNKVIPTGIISNYTAFSEQPIIMTAYKKATSNDVNAGYFELTVDAVVDFGSNILGSIIVKRTKEGINQWISKYEGVGIAGLNIDSKGNIHTLFGTQNTKMVVYNSELLDHSGGTINPYLVGEIDDQQQVVVFVTLSIDTDGITRWARRIILINASPFMFKNYIVNDRPIISLSGKAFPDSNILVSNIITPESNSTFMPPDPLGDRELNVPGTSMAFTFIFSSGSTTTNNVIRSNYYLSPPTTKNKFIYNNSHIDAIVHGRVKNLGVVVNKMIMPGGSSINLAKVPGDYGSDIWVVNNERGAEPIDFL